MCLHENIVTCVSPRVLEFMVSGKCLTKGYMKFHYIVLSKVSYVMGFTLENISLKCACVLYSHASWCPF